VTARRSRRLVVVGGGLAGVAAAVEARRAGLETCLVEQGPELRAPGQLLAELAASGAEALLETAAWGIWGRDLALCESGARSSLLSFEHLIIATGSFEGPLALGLQPEDRLARLAGCAFSGSAYLDPWSTRDACMRTSVLGVLVAGDAGGIVGEQAAIDQGRLAGLAAAMDAGCAPATEVEAGPIQRRLAQPESVFPRLESDTVICSCEGVTVGQLTERLFPGSIEPAGVIAETRATMGVCQGRQCATLVAISIARHAGVPLESIPPITPRPPIVPIPLGAIAEGPPVFLSAAR
jgi:NADPH-dependent 2,4-dienoyl-CoA reductase/sulfur reductase-like enzyme